jgi:hypothetical protein
MATDTLTSDEAEAAARAVVLAAAHRYFEARRARVDDFARRRFGLTGALALHRRALGRDLLRAPANIALAPVHLAVRLTAAGARRLGARGVADSLASRRILLRTDVAREVERLIVVDLLELPWRDDGADISRDALAEAIFRAPEAAAFLREARGGAVADYAEVRSAVAEMTTGLVALGAGAAAFDKLTPGMLSLGPSLAAALAHGAAVSAFPLGTAAGSVWYALFPVAVPPALLVGATAGLVAVGAVAAAFAGILADPAQTALGLHPRRLRRLVDALEADFVGGRGAGFAAREHYVARLLDLADASVGAFRAVGG